MKTRISEAQNQVFPDCLFPAKEYHLKTATISERVPNGNEQPGNTDEGGEETLAWQSALAESSARAMIQASGLPGAAQEHLLARAFTNPVEIRQAIEREHSYLAKLDEDRVVQVGNTPPRGAHISGGSTSLDRISEAYEALLLGVRPKNAQPLSGIQELYHLLSSNDLDGGVGEIGWGPATGQQSYGQHGTYCQELP